MPISETNKIIKGDHHVDQFYHHPEFNPFYSTMNQRSDITIPMIPSHLTLQKKKMMIMNSRKKNMIQKKIQTSKNQRIHRMFRKL
eukprot:10785761-Ditylum_brightwellii.AAC.2